LRFIKVWVSALLLLGLQFPAVAQREPVTTAPVAASDPEVPSIHITSPLGRTGLAMKVRIVAQIHLPPGATISPVSFFVDGQLVGTVEAGPPYSVDWTDENPFERREIVVQAADRTGRTIRDEVVLPPFEVTDRTDVMGVLLETGVYDKSGRMVSTVDPSAFTVLENGTPQKIDLVTREAIPTNLVLLVDNSQSMSRRMDFVRIASERLANTLRARDKVIVAPFNAHVGTITGPTNDPATISQAIRAMHANGGTALLDALLDATHLLKSLEGRRIIVLITDGYDENSTVKPDEVMKAAEEAEETVYAVGIGGVAGISLKGEDLLKKLTDRTGGRVFFPPREADLAPAADTVGADAHNRFLITYTPLNQKKDGTWRDVAVEVPDGLRAKTRAGYFAPAPPPIRPAIEFTIMDGSHSYVDITADDLDVVEDGVPQKVDTFQEAVDPVSIVMALDASGSMKKSADLVRATAREFVTAVRPEDSLALIIFADEPKFEHTLATNRQWTLDAIDKYNPIGGTALYDALWNGIMTLRGVAGRHSVVVLTDGRDENNPGTAPGSTHVLDEVLTLNRQVGAMIFAVGLGTKVDKQVLERLASESGGQAYFATDESMLGGQFGRVVENLRRRYVVSYTSTNSAHDGQWRAVQIKPRTPGQVVSTRGGYFAPER
jgi:VWFA-related protein